MTREEINEWANRNNNAVHCLRVMVDEEVCEECDLLGRVRPTNDIYIIQATSPYDHSTIYLQDKRIRGYGGKWTLYRNNARWFNSKEEAVKVCKQFRYNNAKVVKA